MYLHSLLDDCICSDHKDDSRGVGRVGYSPSKGFIKASLAIVAVAPANAIHGFIKYASSRNGQHHVHVASHAFRLPATLPPASSFIASYAPKWTACAGPAPMITDDTPLQSAREPSVLEMRVNAFPMPEYTADGEVAKTCIRVCPFTKCAPRQRSPRKPLRMCRYALRRERSRLRTLILSTGNITACSVMPAWTASSDQFASTPPQTAPPHSPNSLSSKTALTNAPAIIFTYRHRQDLDSSKAGGRDTHR